MDRQEKKETGIIRPDYKMKYPKIDLKIGDNGYMNCGGVPCANCPIGNYMMEYNDGNRSAHDFMRKYNIPNNDDYTNCANVLLWINKKRKEQLLDRIIK